MAKMVLMTFVRKTPFFESCLPIEEMIRRGPETLRYGPLKPVGLTNKHSNEKPYAVVQLRQDNKLGTLYNIVGFQTKMTYTAPSKKSKLVAEPITPKIEKAVKKKIEPIFKEGLYCPLNLLVKIDKVKSSLISPLIL